MTHSLDQEKNTHPRLRTVQHPGIRCGERVPCPAHGMAWGPHYRPAERLPNGTLVAHDCGGQWRPWERAA